MLTTADHYAGRGTAWAESSGSRRMGCAGELQPDVVLPADGVRGRGYGLVWCSLVWCSLV